MGLAEKVLQESNVVLIDLKSLSTNLSGSIFGSYKELAKRFKKMKVKPERVDDEELEIRYYLIRKPKVEGRLALAIRDLRTGSGVVFNRPFRYIEVQKVIRRLHKFSAERIKQKELIRKKRFGKND